eukprot:CAMPEP_0181479468 /NCGR_PEP_ID=MMETSP1110-20121109/43300_1 /TAXON_ID=174948 /ORGANISM="Symbiodinium sp., Strain CCMP421" /LENGTH=560 /DNA_ID=CAMNT_0023604907 /DNA_START=30 /DNA_END=1712 /DNA_ORIENTATION=-
MTSTPSSVASSKLDQLQTAFGAAKGVAWWATGVPGRLLGKDAAWLAADTAKFLLADLPPVLLGRSFDLSKALLHVRIREDGAGGGPQPRALPGAFVRACRGSLAQAVTPPAPLDDIERILLEDLGLSLQDLFDDFEARPIAAASIAQVHAARLHSGEPCVVKVLRPLVRERLAVDFAAVSLAARLADLVLGEDVVLQMVSASLAVCVEELQRAVMAECDLSVERQNIEDFRNWLETSVTLKRARLREAVRVPRTFTKASSSRVLTMERIHGVAFSEICARHEAPDQWQAALTSALTVAALSVIDGTAIFHADLHAGNMIAVPGPSGCQQVAFIDFGCCGKLPPALRGTLLMQASAFAGSRPDVRQFCEGFAFALQKLPELGTGQALDVDALAEDMKPVLRELQRLNPFRGAADPSPALHMELFRLQGVLCRHGVQLPREFALLMKTGCFGALYFSLLDAPHRRRLFHQLMVAGAAFAASNPREARQLLQPRKLAALLGALRSSDRSFLADRAKPFLVLAACVAVTSANAHSPDGASVTRLRLAELGQSCQESEPLAGFKF